MIYRLAAVSDSKRLAELFWEHADENTPLDPAGKAEYVQVCSEQIENRLGVDLYCWVAEDSGIIIAHIPIAVSRKIPRPGRMNRRWGRLSTVRTVPAYRNQGIGSILMDKVKNWSREQGLEELLVGPSEQSVPFYRRAGFKGEIDLMEMIF